MTTQAYFDDIQQEILKQLDAARESILVAVAWLTDRHIFKKLCDKAEAGLQVELVLFASSKNDTSYFDHRELILCSGKLYEIKQKEDGGIMHHKFCIIDKSTVINGSYNWSRNAISNSENIQITWESETLVKQFTKEFDALKAQCIAEQSAQTEEEKNINTQIRRRTNPKEKISGA